MIEINLLIINVNGIFRKEKILFFQFFLAEIKNRRIFAPSLKQLRRRRYNAFNEKHYTIRKSAVADSAMAEKKLVW